METLREFLGLGVVEFTDFIIKFIFLLFTFIVVAAILIIRFKEIRYEKKQIKAIIENAKKVDEVEKILKVHQRSGFRDIEQAAIDIVKITSRKAVLFFFFILFSSLVFAQEYTDLFPDTRAPYRFRIYEKEVLEAKEIDTIETYWVVKKYNKSWMQGIYFFDGDTTNLVYVGKELERLSPDTNIYLVSPAYYRYDTIYILPTLQGFEKWKQEKGYK